MMKWYGWGNPNFTFPMDQKPKLWPFLEVKTGATKAYETPHIARDLVKLPQARTNAKFVQAMEKHLSPHQILVDDEERLLHTYGKSYPDLLRVRRGEIKQAPDMVILPESHEQVEHIVREAHQAGICLIPFGGGTNIVGGVDPMDTMDRMIATIDMRRMNKIVSIDKYSHTAVIQAGALGPQMEKDLQAQGFSLGHYPDSFEYSTLGGWLATRSAGMQSDAYGKIEDMAVSIRMVTPAGTITTRTVPASSAGPDLNQLVIGSEGVLGIITEATMRVHKEPEVKDYRGYLFRTFEDGVAAIHECLRAGIKPSLIRLQDAGETELAMCMKSPKKGLESWIQAPIKNYLKAKGYTAPCIMVVGFEGEKKTTDFTSKECISIIKKHGAFSLGKGVGKTWSADKFNVPYLRDYVMDYGCMCDVSETAATWTNIMPVYKAVIAAAKARFSAETGKGYIGCHISHTYETGACLYFTYGALQTPGKEMEQYYGYKKAITDAIMKAGGTASHHHAIGYEHIEWMEEEVSTTGLKALRALKVALDPKRILNPGKLIPNEAMINVALPKHEFVERAHEHSEHVIHEPTERMGQHPEHSLHEHPDHAMFQELSH